MARGGTLSVRFSDGTDCTAWTKATLRESFTDPLGSYSITVEPPRAEIQKYIAALRRGERLEFRVNDNPLAVAIITTCDSNVGRSGVSIGVECKSLLCTAYEGSVDPELTRRFKADVSVDTLILDVLGHYGFDTLIGDSSANVNALTGKPPKGRAPARDIKALTLREIQAQEGEAAYAFCTRIVNRLGVVLRCDWEGHLYLSAPDYTQSASYALVQDSTRKRPGDYMLDDGIELHDSNDDLFSEVVVRGAAPDNDGATVCGMPIAGCCVAGLERPSGAPFEKAQRVSLPAGSGLYASTVSQYKPRYVLDKEARDIIRCKNSARLYMSSRAANAHTLSCSVAGFVATTGAIWTPDTVASVYVEALGVDEDMWILEREFSVDGAGERTRLKLLPLGALVLGVDQ